MPQHLTFFRQDADVEMGHHRLVAALAEPGDHLADPALRDPVGTGHLTVAAVLGNHRLHHVARQIHRRHPFPRCPRCSDTGVHDAVNSHTVSPTRNADGRPSGRPALPVPLARPSDLLSTFKPRPMAHWRSGPRFCRRLMPATGG